jgi:DNA-binding GntR family transcriptional regulator
MHLEKEEIAKVVEGSKMKVLKGKEKDACPAEPWNIYNVRKDIADILDLASLLTPLALKRAWKQLDKAHLGRHVKRSDNKSQLQRIICLDEDLHGEILRKCDNPQLTNCLDDIVLQMNFYKQVYLRPFVSQIPESGILIEKTLNAIFEDDYKQARQSLHHHYVCLKNELYAELENILNF